MVVVSLATLLFKTIPDPTFKKKHPPPCMDKITLPAACLLFFVSSSLYISLRLCNLETMSYTGCIINLWHRRNGGLPKSSVMGGVGGGGGSPTGTWGARRQTRNQSWTSAALG